MVEIIEALKNNHIIDSQNVKIIKSYIQQKYPNDPADYTASIFADAIHKIIENNIVHFDEPSRNSIKRNLLIGISQKKEIEINAFEVFEVCTKLYETNDDYIERLTNWINHNQEHIVSVDEVTQLTTEVKNSLVAKTSSPVENNDNFHETNNLLLISDNDKYFEPEQTLGETTHSLDEASTSDFKFNTATQALIARLAVLDEDPIYFLKPTVKKDQLVDPTIINLDLSLELNGKKVIKNSSISNIFLKLKKRNKEIIATFLLITGIITLSNSLEYFDHGKLQNTLSMKTIESPDFLDPLNDNPVKQSSVTVTQNHLPEYLQYKSVNLEALKLWLKERDSALAEEPYLISIHNTAKEYDINPLLMFAITGQEQGFVPNTNADAANIVNNPFNVFGSWEDYNTDIDDSSKIAAITIINLSKDCPENEDPLKWINRKYAEDETWHIGVAKIFSQLEKATTVQ